MEWRRIWCSVLIAVLLGTVCQGERSNHCIVSRAKTCTQCMRVDKDCAYCADEGILYPRCDLLTNLQSKCKQIMQMTSSMKIKRNVKISTSSNRNQISPQEVSMTLRAGEERSVNFQVFQPLEAPVDLYFLMDFSNSMKDDLDNLKKLGLKLAEVVESMSSNYTIGFGKFVDKVTVPQTDMRPSRLKEPWQNSDPPFSFKNVIPLTPNANHFTQELKKERISGNVDAPEGGFDAILQVAVCKENIGWRKQSTHLLVFSTESAFHYEVDGSNVLSGILTRNDEGCHLDSKGTYTDYILQDYPSIPTLVRLLGEQSVIPIFAVTNHSYSYYEKLSTYFPVSAIGRLQEDSSNIIELLRTAFENIRSKMEIRPERVHKTMKSKVSSLSTAMSSSDSSIFAVMPGKVEEFELHVKALDYIDKTHVCDYKEEQKGNLIVKPSTFTDALSLDATLLCDACSCELNAQVNSPKCNGHGDFVCGHCICKNDWKGEFCECDSSNKGEDTACRNPNDPSQTCSGRGECYCGLCHCVPSERHLERFEGKYCEYSSLLCPRFAGFICNGHGECFQEMCGCKEGWKGDSCECPISNATCIDANGGLCNGRGSCVCGRCECDPTDGSIDPACGPLRYTLGLCENIRTCVQCQAWNTGEKKGKNCNKCTNTFEFVEELKAAEVVTERCEFRDEEDDCTFYYTVEILPNSNQTYVQVLKKKGTKVGFKEDRYMLRQSNLTSLDTPMVRTNKPVGTDIVRWKVTDNVHREPAKRYQTTNPDDTILYNLSLRATRIFNGELRKPDSPEFNQLRLKVEENQERRTVFSKIRGPGTTPGSGQCMGPEGNQVYGKKILWNLEHDIDPNGPPDDTLEEMLLLIAVAFVAGVLNDAYKSVPGFQPLQKTKFRLQPHAGKRQDLTIIDTQLPAFRSAEKQIMYITEDRVNMESFNNLQVCPGYYTVASDRDAHGQVEFQDGVDSIDVRVPLFVKDEDDDEKHLQVEAVDVPKGNAEIDQRFVYITIIKEALAKSIITFLQPSYTCQWQDKVAKIPVFREIIDDGRTQVSYRTKDLTAKDGKDYISTENEIIFHPGEIRKEIPISLLEQTEIDNLLGNGQLKQFSMELYKPQNGAKLGKLRETNVIIADDNINQTTSLLEQSTISINSPPTSVKAQPIDSKRIHMNWTAPPGRPTGYKVAYWIEGDENSSRTINTTAPSAELRDLYPYCDYEMNVFAYNALGAGPHSETVECRTLEDLPNEPGRLAFNVISPTVTQLSWAEPSEANGEIIEYEVTYAVVTDENKPIGPKKVVKINKPKKRMIMIENLKEEQPYRYTVRAKNGAGWGPVREATMNLSTQPKRPMSIPIIPDIPIIDAEAHDEYENFLMYSTDVLRSPRPSTSDETGSKWKHVRLLGDDFDGRKVTWKLPVEVIPRLSSSSSLTRASSDIESLLSEDTEYSDTMRRRGTPQPREGQDMQINGKWEMNSLFPGSANSTLNRGTTTTHSGQYTRMTGGSLETHTNMMSGLETSMYGKKGVNYTIAQQMIGERRRAESHDVNTALENLEMVLHESRSPGIPDTPTRLVFSALGATSLKVSWQKPQCDREVLGYRVTYQPLLGGEVQTIDITDPNENSLIINDLLPNQSYMFKVKALSDKGWSPEREGVITIESKVDPMSPLSPVPGSPFTLSTPSAPGPLVFTAINSELLKLNWEKPRKPNGDIMGYLVTCEPLDGQDEIKTYQVEGDDVEMTLMVPHLSENTPYKFKVQAKTTQGYGPEREGIITIESQDGAGRQHTNLSEYSRQMTMKQEGYMLPGNMSAQTSLLDSAIDPQFSEGMTVMTQRMEGGTSITQQVTRTMMTSGTITKQMERKFYEA